MMHLWAIGAVREDTGEQLVAPLFPYAHDYEEARTALIGRLPEGTDPSTAQLIIVQLD